MIYEVPRHVAKTCLKTQRTACLHSTWLVTGTGYKYVSENMHANVSENMNENMSESYLHVLEGKQHRWNTHTIHFHYEIRTIIPDSPGELYQNNNNKTETQSTGETGLATRHASQPHCGTRSALIASEPSRDWLKLRRRSANKRHQETKETRAHVTCFRETPDYHILPTLIP